MSLNPDYLKELFIDQVKPCLSKGGGDIPAVIQALTVTENGTYEAPEGVDGYGPVVVEVASTGGGDDVLNALINRSITDIESDITEIGNYAFARCNKLTTANFPLVTSIGQYAFRDCTALTAADFPLVTSIENYAFNGCTALTAADFPLVTRINQNTFYGCGTLNAVVFPKASGVENSSFQNCSELITADFPVATSISRQAFYGCSKLVSLILRKNNLCTLSDTNALTNTPIASGTGYIYVPSAQIEKYRGATGNWSTYAAQFRALEDYTVDGTTTGALDESKI